MWVLTSGGMIQNFAFQLAQKRISESWVTRFPNLHSSQLTSQRTTAMDAKRYQADPRAKYSLYFGLHHQKITQYDIEPGNTYNMDEKGFMIGVLGRSKRVFDKE